MRRWGLALAAPIATACGLSVTGTPARGGTVDAGTPIADGMAEPPPPLDGGSVGEPGPLDAALDGPWCATQPPHQLCLDFDDAGLGPMKLVNQGNAKCTTGPFAFECTTPSAGSKPYGVAKEWAARPKSVDLTLDLSVTGSGYSQVAGITTTSPYYEILFSPNGGSLDYIEYPSGGPAFSRSIGTQDTAVHRVRLQVNFQTSHVIVSEGGNVKYDADLRTSLVNIATARVFFGLYDTNGARTATIDNVTVDWTE